jgi:glycosyltransferase involved in cell wall biosynthesis
MLTDEGEGGQVKGCATVIGLMRIAWFSPLPPHRSGIAAYSAEILGRLGRHQIDAFIDDGAGLADVAGALPLAGVRILGAHDFPWRHASSPYDAVVYQVGNDSCHDYMWPYLVRYPGLVVLHDAQVHQARASGLIRRLRADDYRAEFRFSHPDADPGIAELVIAGLGGSLYYHWPMVRVAVESARLVTVHSAWLARELAGQFPGRPIQVVRHGFPDITRDAPTPPAEIRRRHGIPEHAVVFGSFGRVTPEKQLSRVLMAMAEAAPSSPGIHLMVVGDTPAWFDVAAEARTLGLASRVTVAGYVDDRDLGDYLRAVDVCLNLRWPTGRETSGAWIRCLAAGKPTVISDLAHLGEIPTLDLRSMATVCTDPAAGEPIAVSVELDHDIHMLRLALAHLARDAGLRARLGAAARRYWAAHASMELMAQDYEAALARVAALPDPARPAGWPAHLSNDGTATLQAIMATMGVAFDWQSGAVRP